MTALGRTARAVASRDIDRVPATRRFDPRRHRRVSGLFDLWLAPGPKGRLMVPTDPNRLLDARSIADLVRRAGDAADDVRILTDDGARHADLFTEVAGLLGHDVLVSPEGTDIRHTAPRVNGADTASAGSAGPLHAVPLHRVTRQPMDWLVLQPPDLATHLPGWFALDEGLVRPRTGVVRLPLADGLALATRADFVARRATAHRLGLVSEGIVTIAVTARADGFLVGNYSGTQGVHSGRQLAALVGDLPLYGADLRLWLTWPSDAGEQARLAEQTIELAETTGATVWTPPPGGRAELVDDHRDLRALDAAGAVAPWRAYRPRYADAPATLDATPDGLLVSRLTRERVTLTLANGVAAGLAVTTPNDPASGVVGSAPGVGGSPADVDRSAQDPGGSAQDPGGSPAGVNGSPEAGREAADGTPANGRVPDAAPTKTPTDGAAKESTPPAAAPTAVLTPPLSRPALVTERRRASDYGPPWLRRGQQVNAETFEAFVRTPGDPAEVVADGMPSTELFLIAFLDPRSAPEGCDLLRVRIEPGGAIAVATLRSHVPARLQYLLGTSDTYLLPAARLDRVRAVGGFRTEGIGWLLPLGDPYDATVRIRSAPTARSTAGLPNDVRRWPDFGTRKAYALLPVRSRGLPKGWLRLYRQPPPARQGRLLVDVRVPRSRTVDVGATAAMLAPLTSVRTRADALHRAGVELILGSRSYDRIQVRRVHHARDGNWQRSPGVTPGPLPATLRRLQSGATTPASGPT
ncbi:hypothetical protein [Micromonospora profundi]|uniref:hypothetical protein n=1 Tax=Micromonospora profundi TaxID=1420889 RepID=UPI003666899C